MNEPRRLSGARGAITLHTVILTLTILGVIGVVLAFAGFTKFGVIVLGLFAAQAIYGWMLYRRMPRPDIAALRYEPADEPADEA